MKEVHHTKAYNAAREIIYQYSASGLIETKKENGKTIEKYEYNKNGQLFKKWRNYYGIDPCHSFPCCQQTFDVYNYY